MTDPCWLLNIPYLRELETCLFIFFFWSGEGGMDEGEKELLPLGPTYKATPPSLSCILFKVIRN